MKPPARKRAKPDRNLNPEPVQAPRKVSCQWQRVEQRNLLKALKTFGRINRGNGDIDYAYLKKHVPTRPISEIQSAVEYLKDKVISLASFKLKKKRWEEKKVRKPIELWTHMASAIAGTRVEPITAAFSQMLIVSSTEPCTLRNCDPPQVHRPPTDRPVGRTVPLRPMPRLPVKVERPGTNTVRPVVVLKTPGPALGPARRLPAPSQVVRVLNSKIPPPQQQLSTTAGTSPASTPTSQPAATSCPLDAAAKILAVPATSPQPTSQTATPVTGQDTPGSGSAAVVKTLIQTTQQPSEQSPTTISTSSTSKSTSSGPPPSLSSSASGQTPVPSTTPSSVPPKPLLSTPAAAFHAKFGRTSKYATKDSPRMFGVKSVVDFERIYRYLSSIHQPNDECHLTPMESAIMLDLLMSLPEELPLLDCKKLHEHLIQVYQLLSSTTDSKMAGEMFRELKDGLCARDNERTNHEQRAAGTADGSDVTASGGKNPQPDAAESQSSGSNNSSGQSGDADEMGLCPALNPFMVPLKLLTRK
ncbi:snRNA-activating protein complex subunit 2 [Anoplopoma fimbria]|uniref:snRNA-activating protein complex subunit 2 n=1 Tax=Anoplopoma fimbria TaxID=229290 RepID=UPI0023EC1830|nr:snRNA-activating protein complex subunit 2 [Anoplopoma fimbria]XP_054457617.1 snRNA-activating protein complex subunit 2 [Anoplopoma fimbria]